MLAIVYNLEVTFSYSKQSIPFVELFVFKIGRYIMSVSW